MRPFSRHIPPAPARKPSSLAWFFLIIVLTAFAMVAWTYPLVTGLLILVIAVSVLFDSSRQKRLIKERVGENICQFARSFDCRKTDTRIIRAVYEELGRSLGSKDAMFPVRAADALFSSQSLNIDSEDLDWIAQDIAFRAGRSLAGAEQNPYFGKIETVADLVAFFTAQPESSVA